MKKITLLIIAFLLVATVPLAFCIDVGTTAASFLKIQPGARPAGMGGAFCGVASDVNAIDFNPAGLTQMKDRQVMVSHNEWIEGIKNEYLGYAQPVNGLWTVGAEVNYLYMQDMTRRDITGNETGSFGSEDGVCTLSAARKINKRVSVGMNVKAISESVDTRRDTAFAADFGVLVRIRNIRLGLTYQNLGTGIKLASETFGLPQNLIVGGSYIFKNGLVALDLNKVLDTNIDVRLGGEYRFANLLSLRTGFVYNQSENTGLGITAGLGLKFEGYQIDYGFVPFGDLGLTHRISLSLKF